MGRVAIFVGGVKMDLKLMGLEGDYKATCTFP